MIGSKRKSLSRLSGVAQSPIEVLEQRCMLSSSPSGLTPAQITAAYGINAIKFGSVVGDGSGQTIAIVNAYDNPELANTGSANFNTSDLHLFDQQFGLADPPSFTKVNQSGGSTLPAQSPPGTATTASWASEADLDVEWAHVVAPKAKIILVEADDGNLLNLIGTPGTSSGAVAYARTIPGVSVVSMSFGIPEFNNGTTNSTETSFDPFFTTPSGHTGITFVAATGDSQTGTYPAFSPNVVAVGDTTLTLNGNSYGSESGFNKSGGGASQYETKPSYQSGISGSKRMIPDVSFDGDPNTGVPVYDQFDASGPWIKLGGTSFSAPVWGALVAIADQGRSLQSMGTLDGPSQTLPKLYSLSSADYHDITTENNGTTTIATGYDEVTGIGTPIANKLVFDLSGYVATTTTGGSISGTIFNDVNGNGVDNSEAGLNGWTVYNDANNDGVKQASELSAMTDASGNYSFTGLAAGSYKIRQILPSGWKQTTPASGFGWTISLSSNQSQTGKNFGAESTSVTPPPPPTGASISGTIFNDVNGNGVDNSEAGLSSWTVYNDANNNGVKDGNEISTTTDASGNYSFTGLSAGSYKIRQILPSGWKQTTPSNGFGWTVSLSTNQAATGKIFGAESTGGTTPPPPTGATISGTVFNDANGNGKFDSGEADLSGWTVYLDLNNTGVLTASDPQTSTTNGAYSFTGLKAGTYIVRVIRPSGWSQTTPANGLGQHVSVSTNQTVGNIIFGEKS